MGEFESAGNDALGGLRRASMRIDSVETYVIEDSCIVRVRAEDGTFGVGQGTYFESPHAVEQLVLSFASALVGKDPSQIERNWHLLNRSSSFRGAARSSALAALDIATWDLVGRALGLPVYQLLGGMYRRRMRLYRNIGRAETVDELADRAATAVGDGYTAVKVDPVPFDHLDRTDADLAADVLARVTAVREAVGPSVDVAVDFHNRLSPAQAVAITPLLAALRPMFVEDPIPADGVADQGRLAQRLGVPVAAGERLTNVVEFRELLESGGIDIVRPDVGLAGGLTQARKIAAVAEAFQVGLAPHHNIMPIAAAATLHLDASIPNFVIQSYLDDHLSPRSGLLKQPLVPVDGYLEIADSAGLGIELNEDYLREHGPLATKVESPVAGDGSIGYP